MTNENDRIKSEELYTMYLRLAELAQTAKRLSGEFGGRHYADRGPPAPPPRPPAQAALPAERSLSEELGLIRGAGPGPALLPAPRPPAKSARSSGAPPPRPGGKVSPLPNKKSRASSAKRG